MNDIPAQLLDWETRFFLTRGPTPQAILAQVMDVGEMSDFETLDQLFSIETLRDVVSCSHPLWFRPKSWAFWHMQLFGTASFDELPPPPHWAIDMKHPADADLHVIPPEHAQAAIEWLAQLNQITPVIEATAGFMDDRPPDVVQRTAIALKAAGILSRRQYGRLLAQYVKYRAFLNPVNASSKMNELLAQCDAEIPLDECDQAWLNAPAVGLEIIDDNPSPEVEFTPFLQALVSQLPAVAMVEVCDLANVIGLVLARQCSNHTAMIQNFQHGFLHGVDLAIKENMHDETQN